MKTKLSILLFLAIALTIHRASAWDGFHKFSGSHAGQRVEGLSKLKNYFHRFGYIPSKDDFSDEYDESLESAVKLYQQNFRLTVTGEFDDATLSHIVKPRCGVADIINGTNTMADKTTLSVAHYAFFGAEEYRWPSSKTTLTYAFLPENQLSVPIKSVFTRAFARWSAVIPLNFTVTENYNGADIKIGFYNGNHGDGEPFDGILGVLAHSFAPTDGRFHLDNAETWVYDSDVKKSSVKSAVDMESVATHEIGHLLGLDHSADKNAIMYPYLSPRTRKVDLTTDDVDGVQVLYGRNPSYNPSAKQFDNYVSGTGDGGAWLLLPSLWGLAAVLWCLIF